MTLFNKIRGAKKTLGNLLLAGTLAIAGCSGGCGTPAPEPSNHNPVFTSTPLTSATEDTPYSYDADATDPDTADILTYSLTQAPTGMTIDSNTGLIQWTPDDSQTAQNHNITVKVEDDKGGFTNQNYSINAINTETISGYVSDVMDNAPLENILVHVGTRTDSTDSGGYWEINAVPDGDHTAMVEDTSPNYDAFKPGFFRVSKTSKLEQDCVLFEDKYLQFIDECIRDNGEVRKWKTKPMFRIFTKEAQGGLDVDVAKITAVKDVIKNECTQFANSSYDFTDTDIEEINTTPTFGFDSGYVKIRFDNSVSYGINSSQFNGNEITGVYVGFNPSVSKNVHLQELTESLIGGGETHDNNYITSVLHDPGSGATSYSNHDLMLSELVYGNLQRAAGNADYGTPNNHDRNPDTHQWNQDFTSPLSYT